MTRWQFWILNLVSLTLVGVITFEFYSSDALDQAQSRARLAQLPLWHNEQLQPLARSMVERTVQGSARDPALRELLTKYGVHVTTRPVETNPTTTSNP